MSSSALAHCEGRENSAVASFAVVGAAPFVTTVDVCLRETSSVPVGGPTVPSSRGPSTSSASPVLLRVKERGGRSDFGPPASGGRYVVKSQVSVLGSSGSMWDICRANSDDIATTTFHRPDGDHQWPVTVLHDFMSCNAVRNPRGKKCPKYTNRTCGCRVVQLLKHTDIVRKVRVVPGTEGTRIVSGSDDAHIHCWNTSWETASKTDYPNIRVSDCPVYSVRDVSDAAALWCFRGSFPDCVASSGQTHHSLRLWNFVKGGERPLRNCGGEKKHTGWVFDLTERGTDDSGGILYSASEDKSVKMWDLRLSDSECVVATFELKDWCHAVCAVESSHALLCGTYDGYIRVLDSRRGSSSSGSSEDVVLVREKKMFSRDAHVNDVKCIGKDLFVAVIQGVGTAVVFKEDLRSYGETTSLFPEGAFGVCSLRDDDVFAACLKGLVPKEADSRLLIQEWEDRCDVIEKFCSHTSRLKLASLFEIPRFFTE